MLVLINAFKSITRSKGRNILIGIIVFVIATAACVSLAIRGAATQAEEQGRENLQITASISLDRQSLMENAGQAGDRDTMREMMGQVSGLSLEEQEYYATSSYVSDFYYSASLFLSAGEGVEPVSTSSSSGSSDTADNFGGQMPGGGGGFAGGTMSMGDFSLTGYSSESAMTDFLSGNSKVIDGEVFDTDSSSLTCLISQELATFNGLLVGDTITVTNPNAEDESYTFEVVGIYSSKSSTEDGMAQFSSAMDPANQILVSYFALEQITLHSESVAVTETDDEGRETSTALTASPAGTYTFSSLENYESFLDDITAMGLSENYTVSSVDLNSYESSLTPLKNLSSFAGIFLLVILLVGAVILIVLNIFNIRERKYEVGVLMAIGINKVKVSLQFVTELLAVTLVAIVLGAVAGSIISVPVSNTLLESVVSSQEQQSLSQNQNFGREGMQMPDNAQAGGMSPGGGQSPFGTAANYVSQINATVNLTVLLELIGIGILLTAVSSLVGIIFVSRYEPLVILSSRA